MTIIKLLAFVAFLASIVWFCAEPGYEPAIAIITSLSTVIGLWLSARQARIKATQAQTVASGGVAVQAGGDAHVGSISNGGTKNAE
jgi:hypothetical protein